MNFEIGKYHRKIHSLACFALLAVLFLPSNTTQAQQNGLKTVPVPLWFGRVIAQHIEKMYAQGNFIALDEKDFFHGHVLLKRRPKTYGSLEHMLVHATLVLYHTDEYTGRWQAEGRDGEPPERRTQRSIVGYTDGTVQNAIELIPPEQREGLPFYVNYGTIFDTDIASENPKKFRQDALFSISFRQAGKKVEVINQFSITPNAKGRFLLGALRYDIAFELPIQ